MGRYLLIESRDPFESNDVARVAQLARELSRAGNEVTVLLVQNAVAGARRGAHAKTLIELAASDIEVLADEFSLRERAIPPDRLVHGVSPTPLSIVIDRMASGAKTLWH